MIQLSLTPEQAESLAVALIHTRREYLSLTDRNVVHELSCELSPYERPLSIQAQRQRAHQYIQPL
jgi:hypothetical protein